MTINDKKIVIIGAGIAGLAAAQSFQKHGFGNVVVLEGRDRIGGRIWTDKTIGMSVDLGASWIHGASKRNPITQLAKKAKAQTFVLEEEAVEIFRLNGQKYTKETVRIGWKKYQNILKKVDEHAEENKSIREVIEEINPEILEESLMRYFLSADKEFDYGNDINKLSSMYYESDEVIRGEDQIITNGYQRIVEYLADGVDVRLNQKVVFIDYDEEDVLVETEKGNFLADYVVCTLPLGVLQSGDVTFEPELPEWKAEAIGYMEMGTVNKVVLTFPKCFWNKELHYIGITSKEKGKYNYFLNYKKINEHPTLMTFAFGDFAKEMEKHTNEQVQKDVMAHLKVMYGKNIPEPTDLLRSQWHSDPFCYGSYTAAVKGMNDEEFELLAENIDGKLFFAGEHTHHTFRGTVHGAYLSGEEVVQEVLELLSV